ncbi:uncharacterized protein MONOS_15623 [Monocercomonoides exilis]|uniref:uncharacterized protein n=1 Tax=Monocercomonoides exilis TaxID=2049356 RepID=UPI0035593792|nr:hypothetical protein MONOS_15623 [Monocercomonoides exilis]|eukprot:MONOS_15623.1-p1 / transcript=MONOS_15623.1 / gene=MONOS_15623 / organism=Monocercomonoides_exilis_PA203 / gene_product=unspecified product / transcript_product=unspecified product / location=Mono_scaffold01290:9234-12014(-) / protein_length=708 / sequence_SO=supercontig / SO=protein_coding / is_pseudo=false
MSRSLEAFERKVEELKNYECTFVELTRTKSSNGGNFYKHPKNTGEEIGKIHFETCDGKLWLAYTPVKTDGSLKKDGHIYFLCPNSKQGINCAISGRKGCDKVVNHRCALTTASTILPYFKFHPSSRLSEASAKKIVPTHFQFDSLVEQYLHLIGHCNIAFLSAYSNEFNKFISSLIIVSQHNPSLSPTTIFPTLTYRKLTALIQEEGKKRISERNAKIFNSMVAVMMDGGIVAGKKYTVITIVPLQTKASPFFWKIEKACFTTTDYFYLANDIIGEVSNLKGEVRYFLSKEKIDDVIRCELLLAPLKQLQLLFENDETKLGDVFPNVLKSIAQYMWLQDLEEFSSPDWQYGVCFIVIQLFNSFLGKERGDQIALAHSLTPISILDYRNGLLSKSYSTELMTLKEKYRLFKCSSAFSKDSDQTQIQRMRCDTSIQSTKDIMPSNSVFLCPSKEIPNTVFTKNQQKKLRTLSHEMEDKNSENGFFTDKQYALSFFSKSEKTNFPTNFPHPTFSSPLSVETFYSALQLISPEKDKIAEAITETQVQLQPLPKDLHSISSTSPIYTPNNSLLHLLTLLTENSLIEKEAISNEDENLYEIDFDEAGIIQAEINAADDEFEVLSPFCVGCEQESSFYDTRKKHTQLEDHDMQSNSAEKKEDKCSDNVESTSEDDKDVEELGANEFPVIDRTMSAEQIKKSLFKIQQTISFLPY